MSNRRLPVEKKPLHRHSQPFHPIPRIADYGNTDNWPVPAHQPIAPKPAAPSILIQAPAVGR